MCEEFAKQDPRVRLIVQRNGGAAAARNMGILNAKGEYLTFVDSDDCLDADYLQVLYDAMVENEADMSMVNYRLFEPTERGVKFVNYITADDVETMVLDPRQAVSLESGWHLNGSVFMMIWGKLFKKECLEGFAFPEGMMYEDEAATHRMILRSHKVAFVNDPHYSYRFRSGSVSRDIIDDKNLQDLVRAYKMKIADFTTAGIPTKNVRGRYLAAIKEKLEQTRDQGPQFPGYHECQEVLRLADLNQ
nr:glycosyltransferase [Limosilactobacillus fermentum]